MPKEAYNTFFEKLKDNLDDDEKQFVDRFRSQGNYYSLSQQLEKIFLQLDFWKENPSKYKRCIDEIVSVRNHISHATRNITPETLINANNVTQNLTSFITSLILHEIKFAD